MPEVKTATCRVSEFKALPADQGGGEGVFEAIVAVFDNVDYGDDRIVKGAFADSLNEWATKGDPIPVIWSHQWGNPMAHIGVVLEAREIDSGLWVKAQIDMDSEFAVQVFRLLKSRRVTQFSIGYEAVKFAMVDDPNRRWPVRELLAVNLFEVGPTLLGMNPDTDLISAASRPGPGGKATGDPVESGSRDDAATIPVERIRALMALTRHTEE